MFKIFKKIIEKINIIIEDEIIYFFKDVINYNWKKIIIYFLTLPFTIFFIIINLIVFFYFLFFYIFIFLYNFIKIKNNYIKKKIIKFKKKFKSIKQFHLIIIKKVFFVFPQKKAFLVFYFLLKSIYEKKISLPEKEILIKYTKIICNRVLINFMFGLPFIVLNCNRYFVNTIFDICTVKSESVSATINTIWLNVFYKLTPNYTNLIEKLKITIIRKKKKKVIITFNSEKEILKAIKYTKEFKNDFEIIKKNSKYGLFEQIINKNKKIKGHPTLAINTNENSEKTIYLNETTKKEIKYIKFHKELQKYIEEKQKNSFIHKGSISSKKIAYFTDNIETKKENMILINPKNKIIIENIEKENINNIIAAFTSNLNKELIETNEIKTNNIKKNELIKNIYNKNTINWIKENKNNLTNETYETILRLDFFWKENEKIIESIPTENKIKLAKILGIGLDYINDTKELNFQLFRSFIENDIKDLKI